MPPSSSASRNGGERPFCPMFESSRDSAMPAFRRVMLARGGRQSDRMSHRRTFFAILWQSPQLLRTDHETINVVRGANAS